MPFERTYIPYAGLFSTPFCRWQGALAGINSLDLGARAARRFLAERRIDATALDGLVLGFTVPQRQGFYGAPWVASQIGAPSLTGPSVAQACATSARLLATAAAEIETGLRECVLALACDRTSNGPHVYYPDAAGPGGRGRAEDPVWDGFQCDPATGQSMVQTAENVARAEGIDRAAQDEMALLRHRQYADALAGDRAFQRRYFVAAEVPRPRGEPALVEADDGVHPTAADGLARLRPVLDGGTVTFGTQTHPADGAAGAIVTTRDRAASLAPPGAPAVRLLAFASARVEPAMMPRAPVPAARRALDAAWIAPADVGAWKTHNPFAVNDVYFCREMGLAPDRVNRYGSPLVWGHPQAPTGLRAVAELCEELALAGGGYGLFSGCAAGDTAMAVVLRVG